MSSCPIDSTTHCRLRLNRTPKPRYSVEGLLTLQSEANGARFGYVSSVCSRLPSWLMAAGEIQDRYYRVALLEEKTEGGIPFCQQKQHTFSLLMSDGDCRDYCSFRAMKSLFRFHHWNGQSIGQWIGRGGLIRRLSTSVAAATKGTGVCCSIWLGCFC